MECTDTTAASEDAVVAVALLSAFLSALAVWMA